MTKPIPITLQSGEDPKTLLQALDELAKGCPDHTWWKVPKDVELAHGWRDITSAELAQAVDGMAKWIVVTPGIGTKSSDVAASLASTTSDTLLHSWA